MRISEGFLGFKRKEYCEKISSHDYSYAVLAANIYKKRRAITTSKASAVTGVAAAHVSGGISLMGSAWAGRNISVEKQKLQLLEEEWKRRGQEPLPKHKSAGIIPIIISSAMGAFAFQLDLGLSNAMQAIPSAAEMGIPGNELAGHAVGAPYNPIELEKGLGKAEKGLGEAEKEIGEAEKGLGDAKKGLGDAEKGLGDTEKGLEVAEKESGVAEKGVEVAERGSGVAEKGLEVVEKGSRLAEVLEVAEKGSGLVEEGSGLAEKGSGLAEKGLGLSEEVEDTINSLSYEGKNMTIRNLQIPFTSVNFRDRIQSVVDKVVELPVRIINVK